MTEDRLVRAGQALQAQGPLPDNPQGPVQEEAQEEEHEEVFEEALEEVIMTEFEDKNLADSENRALEIACKQLDKFQWMDCDLHFYFSQVEARMSAVGVKKQWTKFTVLNTILPMKVLTEVKTILKKREADFADGLPYKALKKEILRIFGPRLETGCERALKRTLTGKPSQLARQIIDDICQHNMTCDCCPGGVLAIWKRSLPVAVKAQRFQGSQPGSHPGTC